MQTEWALVIHIFATDGAKSVPEIKHSGNDDSDTNADGQKKPVCGQPDQRDGYDQSRRNQRRRASNWNCDGHVCCTGRAALLARVLIRCLLVLVCNGGVQNRKVRNTRFVACAKPWDAQEDERTHGRCFVGTNDNVSSCRGTTHPSIVLIPFADESTQTPRNRRSRQDPGTRVQVRPQGPQRVSSSCYANPGRPSTE
jgi:hypothetical protein